MTDTHEGWIANMSDGNAIPEAPPVAGEPSGWQKMLTRCRKGDITITGLVLKKGGTEVVAMPNKMCDGYFQASEVAFSFYKREQVHKQGIGSVVGDSVFITWVDGEGRVYQEVRSLDTVRLHTTMEEHHDTTRQRSS